MSWRKHVPLTYSSLEGKKQLVRDWRRKSRHFPITAMSKWGGQFQTIFHHDAVILTNKKGEIWQKQKTYGGGIAIWTVGRSAGWLSPMFDSPGGDARVHNDILEKIKHWNLGKQSHPLPLHYLLIATKHSHKSLSSCCFQLQSVQAPQPTSKPSWSSP